MERKSHASNDAPDREAQRGALPPLNALRSFEAVARHGSFAAAAMVLNVTHWAVGKQIRLLEDWFGKPLFERRARGVHLTDEGASLLADVGRAFDHLAAGAVRLRQATTTVRLSGLVRVNALSSVALCWLIPRLADFQKMFPEIEVQLSTSSRKLRYVGDAFDVGIRSGRESTNGLIWHILMPDLRLPACSPALLQDQPIRTVADLRHHTLLHSTSTRTDWSAWMQEAGVSKHGGRRDIHFDHVYLQLGAAVEGLGVALASLPLIERDLAAGRLVCPLPGPLWRGPDYTLVVSEDRAHDRAVQAFTEWITAMASQST